MIEENIRLAFTNLNDRIAAAPVSCVCKSESTTHVKLQTNQWEIFSPKNQSFSSLIEIYLHLYHIWVTWKTHTQRLIGISIGNPKFAKIYTSHTDIWKIYTVSTLIWISVKRPKKKRLTKKSHFLEEELMDLDKIST